jgi:uroporphyrinogen-III synthase
VKLLIVRPQPGASASAARAAALGFDPILLPLFSIIPRSWRAADIGQFDALLITSANAVRHAGDGLQDYRSLPVHAVGERSAAACAKAELLVASTGHAGIEQAMASAMAAGHRRLFWLAGEDRRSPAIPGGMQLEIATSYAAQTLPLPSDAREIFAQCGAIALHSPRAARRVAATVDQLALSRSKFIIAAFSLAVAEAAGEGWRGVALAPQPSDDAMLSALTELDMRLAQAG